MPVILLLDDNFAFLKVLSIQIESEGFKVVPFRACLSAMQFVTEKRGEFDLVLSDLKMPDASGLDFLAALRETDPSTPFFLMTGETEFDEEQVLKLGGQGVFHKPLTMAQVTTRLRESLVEPLAVSLK